MATLRGSSNFYAVGNKPPTVLWTVVRGDTASFRVYVTDDSREPLNVEDWNIAMEVKRPADPENAGKITDNATLILSLVPEKTDMDGPGEFTVSLTAQESEILQTGDIFDIELSLPNDELVWTVAQGSLEILEDVTA
jgi:hypothetical protein